MHLDIGVFLLNMRWNCCDYYVGLGVKDTEPIVYKGEEKKEYSGYKTLIRQ